jgi:hypothetical protein
MKYLRAFAAACAAVLLAGCASGYLLENRVQSFSGLTALPASPTYRFDRLPSQAASASQPQVEALADPALFKAGLRRDDAAPKFAVQVSARVQRVLSPWGDPFYDPWGWGGFGWRGRYGWAGPPIPYARVEPWFHREVGVVVRDLGSNKVVFESQAVNDGPVLDDALILSAMFDAALQGFPNPPQGPRRVNVQVGGQQQPAAAAPAVPASAPAPAPSPSR